MAQVIPERVTAQVEGDFVVFLIGMRINKPWKIHQWLPAFLAMPRLLRELAAHPECGCLGHIATLGVIVQYWRSFEDLEAYARSKDRAHWSAWLAFKPRTTRMTRIPRRTHEQSRRVFGLAAVGRGGPDARR